MSARLIVELALGGVAAIELVVVLVLAILLHRSRRETAKLRGDLDAFGRAGPFAAAGRAVKTVVETAARVRDQGVGGFLTSSIEDVSKWAAADRAQIARVAASDGTVVIVFSDIEDSTALNEELGDAAWVRLLQAHDALVRRQIGRHRGHVVKSQGDGFMIVFGEASDAIAAAVGTQRAMRDSGGRQLRRTPIHIRIGVHVGEVISRDGDYFGRNVAFAARVAAQANGDEILISDDVRSRLGEDGLELTSRGTVELKGLAGVHDLWAVEWR